MKGLADIYFKTYFSFCPTYSKISTTLDILKDSEYIVAIRALTGPNNNSITLELGSEKTEVSLYNPKQELKWIYLDTELQRGKYELKLSSDREVEIDNIIIYSTNKDNETLDDVFISNKVYASVTYKMINPTKYIVHVNATKPFMLAFAESYDPLWVAHSKNYFTRSISLYSVINGFYINKTGNYDLIIEFEPQKYVYIGLIITILTILVSMILIIREREKKL